MLAACDKSEMPQTPSGETTLQSDPDGMIRLKRKKEIPFTVTNIQKAYERLANDGHLKKGLVFGATHRYVRALPANESESDPTTQPFTLRNTLISNRPVGVTTEQIDELINGYSNL